MQKKLIVQIMEDVLTLPPDMRPPASWVKHMYKSLLLEAERRLQERHDAHEVKDENAIWDFGFRTGCAEGIQILRKMIDDLV